MSEAVAANAPAVAVPATPAVRPGGAEVLAAGLAAIALGVLQLVHSYAVPYLLTYFQRLGSELPELQKVLVQLDMEIGAGRWLIVALWCAVVFTLRRSRRRSAFVIGSALVAIAGVALALTIVGLTLMVWALPLR